jgi:hypothetical protein
LAQPYGIGRDIFMLAIQLALKAKAGFEPQNWWLLLKQYHLLENIHLYKTSLLERSKRLTWYGNWLCNGVWATPWPKPWETLKAFNWYTKHVTGKYLFPLLLPTGFVNRNWKWKWWMNNKFGKVMGEMNNRWSRWCKRISKKICPEKSKYHLSPYPQ